MLCELYGAFHSPLKIWRRRAARVDKKRSKMPEDGQTIRCVGRSENKTEQGKGVWDMVRKASIYLPSTTLAFLLSQQVMAQTASVHPGVAVASPMPASSSGVQDIIVTAQRRQESAQKTALSIEVFGGASLRQAGVHGPDDLAKLATGVQIGGGATTQIYIRGIGDSGVTATANPAVTTSIDGVAIARPQAISGNFFDVERLEVLKGPQGTLYGRNASGGALNILTVAPKLGETSGYAEATVGNYSQYGIEGALNVAAGKDAAFRVSYQVNRRDGYLTDGGDDDKHESVRLQSRFEPSDKLSVRTILSFTHLGGNGTGFVRIPKLDGSSPWTGNTSTVAGDAYIAAAASQYNTALAAGCNPDPSRGNCPVPASLIGNPKDSDIFQNIKSYNASLQADYNLGFATLTLLPGYRRTRSRFATQPGFFYNVGGVYDAAGDRSKGETSHQYSVEARLGHQSNSFNWVIGGYYFNEKLSTNFTLQGGPILNTMFLTDLNTETAAAFGQATYSVVSHLRVTGGVRYTSDKREALDYHLFAISPSVSAPGASTGLPPVPCLPNVAGPGTNPPGALCSLTNTTPGYYNSMVRFNRVTWKAGLELDVRPGSLLFADVSTGFKAGGFSQAVSLTDPTKLQPYRPETVTAYTLGSKNRFLDNKLQVNLEAFYIDYKNLQLSVQSIDGTGTIALSTQNAGRARIAGGNVSVIAKPWRGGTIHGSVEYADSTYKQFLLMQPALFVPPGRVGCPVSAPDSQGIVTIDCSGKPLVRSMKWSGNAGISQIFDLPENDNLVLSGEVTFGGPRYLGTDFIPAQHVGGYANASASLTYNAARDRYFVSLFVRNIANATIFNGGGIQSGFVNGWATNYISPPRTFGVRAGVKF